MLVDIFFLCWAPATKADLFRLTGMRRLPSILSGCPLPLAAAIELTDWSSCLVEGEVSRFLWRVCDLRWIVEKFLLPIIRDGGVVIDPLIAAISAAALAAIP